MSDFKCFRGFTTRTGKEYSYGILISEAEYDALHFMDKIRFIRVAGTARYRPPDRDDNETFPVVLPVFDRPDTSDWSYDVRNDTRNQTNQDDTPQHEYGGGSFGGAGAGSNYDTRDNDRDDTDSHSDNDNDTSDDRGGSNKDD